MRRESIPRKGMSLDDRYRLLSGNGCFSNLSRMDAPYRENISANLFK